MELSDLGPARRDQLSIIAGFLETARGTASKNEIRRRANLSSERLEHYLTLTTAIGLLDWCTYADEYKTTEKGIRFLSLFSCLQQLLGTKNNNKDYRNDVQTPHDLKVH
jgi:predicted transcriptional regulator